MHRDAFRYVFSTALDFEDVEASLVLALLAAESLHSQAQVRLDAAHYLDSAKRACVIDAVTPVGRDINRLFVGFISREFGPDSFEVERVGSFSAHKPEEVAA